jgi:hypothetical protein
MARMEMNRQAALEKRWKRVAKMVGLTTVAPASKRADTTSSPVRAGALACSDRQADRVHRPRLSVRAYMYIGRVPNYVCTHEREHGRNAHARSESPGHQLVVWTFLVC